MDLLPALNLVSAIAAEGSFSAGARRCGVHQPTASRQVARIERELGLPIFARTTRAVELTTFGEAVLSAGQDLIAAEEQFRHLVAAARDERIVLALPAGPEPLAVARIVARCRVAGISIDPVTGPLEDPHTPPHRVSDALVRADPATADWSVPLGFAGELVTGGASFDLHRLLHGSSDRYPYGVLLLPRDGHGEVSSAVAEGAAAAGLAADQVRTLPEAEALSEVITGDGVICCSAAEAESWQLPWRSADDLPLSRHWRLRTRNPDLRSRLLRVCGGDIAAALGAVGRGAAR